MLDKLIKDALLFTTGAAVGVAGALWLMSDSGKQMRSELRDLASQATDKIHDFCEQAKQEMEAAQKAAQEQSAEEA